jgi:hypothetical protein
MELRLLVRLPHETIRCETSNGLDRNEPLTPQGENSQPFWLFPYFVFMVINVGKCFADAVSACLRPMSQQLPLRNILEKFTAITVVSTADKDYRHEFQIDTICQSTANGPWVPL